MRFMVLAPLCALISVAAPMAVAAPSVRDIVEFTRFVQPQDEDDNALREQISPDGTRAFIVTRRGDVASDTNVYEIRLLDLVPGHLVAQSAPAAVTVFSVAVGHDSDYDYAFPAIRNVQWHGNRSLAFLGRLHGTSTQVYSLDMVSRKLVQRTHDTNVIVSYAASEDIRRVVYATQMPNPPFRHGDHGIVVGNKSFRSVVFGQSVPDVQQRKYRFFVADATSPRAARPLGDEFDGDADIPRANISPDGRWALLHRRLPDRLAGWERQYPMVAEVAGQYARADQVDPLRYFSGTLAYTPRVTIAWHLDDGKAQTVVDAPDDSLPGGAQMKEDMVWQGRGTSVILAGTHLPRLPDGTSSPSSHVIEYWPDSGQWKDVTSLQDRFAKVNRLGDGFLVFDGDKRREFHREASGGWRESTGGSSDDTRTRPSWTLHVRQGLNQPPDVYAQGPFGESVRLTQLNPGFAPDAWGTMRPYTWIDSAGRQWKGGLMSGANMDSHTPHPLLIQTYGFDRERFYLDAPNTSNGATSGFAGRAFLDQGILVLQMPWGPEIDRPEPDRRGLEAFIEGVRGAIQALAVEGRIDPSRVGIMGWSATGERVLNLLTFADVPIRAASSVDGDSNTLFKMALAYGLTDTAWGRLERLNESVPFGDKLPTWALRDPALHTDCIHAALRIESYSLVVRSYWDIYALLRRQYKAADMILFPGGRHALANPGDRMLSLQGNVDWFGFWLAGKTRTVPVVPSETPANLQAQYAQWRQMEALKSADDARPACVR